MSKFPKGSEWRKWDLHIHTPLSIEQGYGGEAKFDEFIDSLEKLPNEVKVLGITDYYFLDGYERIIKEKLENGRLPKIEKIFPIMEFRIDTFSSASSHDLSKVNLHILFDLDESRIAEEISTVRTQFLGQLQISRRDKERSLSLGEDAFIQLAGKLKVGFAELIPKAQDVYRELEKPEWKDKAFLFLGYKEWSNLDFGMQLREKKRELLSKADAILTAGEIDAGKKRLVEKFDMDTPFLHSLDIHNLAKLGADYECNTWIKADPTFEGLKQIIYEPDDRVFIGEKPPILKRVEGDKTRYIKSLSINHAPGYDGNEGIWFNNISMDFNKELVAIIGNKGSGKSAVADILAFLGDTHQELSFLNKEKFLSNNKKLATNFCAQIEWESGTGVKKLLSDEIKNDSVESIRYIPQNYFERLTNAIEIKEFRSELEKIIFTHLPKDEKLGQSSFAKLREYKSQSINKEIEILEGHLHKINQVIIGFEAQQYPEFIKNIENEIASKAREIEEQEKLLASLHESIKLSPNQTSQFSQVNKDIVGLRAQKSKIEQQLEEYQKQLQKINIDGEELRQIEKDLEGLSRGFSEFSGSNKQRMASQGLNIDKIVQLEIDSSSVQNKLEEKRVEYKNILPFLLPVDGIEDNENPDLAKEQSLPWRIDVFEKKINELEKQLDSGQRQIAQNNQRIQDIDMQIKKLRGEEQDPAPDTLNFYQQQKTFVVNDLDSEIERTRNERVKISLEIFRQKKEILEFYDSFKEPVAALIKKEETLNDYNINIDVFF